MKFASLFRFTAFWLVLNAFNPAQASVESLPSTGYSWGQRLPTSDEQKLVMECFYDHHIWLNIPIHPCQYVVDIERFEYMMNWYTILADVSALKKSQAEFCNDKMGNHSEPETIVSQCKGLSYGIDVQAEKEKALCRIDYETRQYFWQLRNQSGQLEDFPAEVKTKFVYNNCDVSNATSPRGAQEMDMLFSCMYDQAIWSKDPIHLCHYVVESSGMDMLRYMYTNLAKLVAESKQRAQFCANLLEKFHMLPPGMAFHPPTCRGLTWDLPDPKNRIGTETLKYFKSLRQQSS